MADEAVGAVGRRGQALCGGHAGPIGVAETHGNSQQWTRVKLRTLAHLHVKARHSFGMVSDVLQQLGL